MRNIMYLVLIRDTYPRFGTVQISDTIQGEKPDYWTFNVTVVVRVAAPEVALTVIE